MENIGGGWHRDFEGEYEIHVMSHVASRNGVEISGVYGYNVKILPPGADADAREAWIQFSSGEGVEFQTTGEALDAGIASARRRIFDEFGELDLPSEPRLG
ncbi:hypothetical protein V4C53_36155 [Paraburkholderia azotifigens]|uniref:hypothetical protein n=1 Tax=Paraburkholderia azotifigens TaxID=2057004 RepID=UPI00316D0D66